MKKEGHPFWVPSLSLWGEQLAICNYGIKTVSMTWITPFDW